LREQLFAAVDDAVSSDPVPFSTGFFNNCFTFEKVGVIFRSYLGIDDTIDHRLQRYVLSLLRITENLHRQTTFAYISFDINMGF
jgi:hypothetical protein